MPRPALDRMGKSLGLLREVQVGDADFDAAAFVSAAASDEQVRAVLQPPEVRRLVREVLRLGYRVEMSRDGLRGAKLDHSLHSFDGSPVPGVTRALAPSLHAPLDDGDTLRAMGYGLVAWVPVTALILALLRARVRSMAEVFVIALALLVGVPSLGTMALFAANSGLDRSGATTRRARVLSRQRRDSELYVTPWDPGRARQKVGVPRALWREAQVGDALEVDTHPGALGWTWASGVRRLP